MELGREEAKGVPGGRKEGRGEERGEGKAGAGLLLGGRERAPKGEISMRLSSIITELAKKWV